MAENQRQSDQPQRPERNEQRPDRQAVERKTFWKRVGSAAAVVAGMIGVAVRMTRRR
ncbi:MAG: hypothetical protein ACLFUJ_00960 [Phycisphaerae bacterium]